MTRFLNDVNIPTNLREREEVNMYKSMMAQNIIIIIINAAPPRRNGA